MNPDFEPHSQLIASIDNSVTATVTTVNPHGFTTGTVVRVIVPLAYGMSVAIFAQTSIVVTGLYTFLTSIDTSVLNVFTPPTFPPAFTPAQVTLMTGTQHNVAI